MTNLFKGGNQAAGYSSSENPLLAAEGVTNGELHTKKERKKDHSSEDTNLSVAKKQKTRRLLRFNGGEHLTEESGHCTMIENLRSRSTALYAEK
jgi:hypothetical protein